MVETDVKLPMVADPALRSSIYEGLALGWRYPTREAFEAYQAGIFTEDLLEFAAELPHLGSLVAQEAGTSEKVSHDLAGVPFEAFEVAYVNTFDVGFPEPPCPPYEGQYHGKLEHGPTMVEVSEFYRHFGLKLSQDEEKRELPDYLCVELEFLQFLTFKEAQATQEGTEELLNGYRWAQKDFLERHMIAWFPQFLEKVRAVEGLPFYPDLGRITLAFANAEYALLTGLVKTDINADEPSAAGEGESQPEAAQIIPAP